MNQARNSQHTYFQSPAELLILAAPWGREDGGKCHLVAER